MYNIKKKIVAQHTFSPPFYESVFTSGLYGSDGCFAINWELGKFDFENQIRSVQRDHASSSNKDPSVGSSVATRKMITMEHG